MALKNYYILLQLVYPIEQYNKCRIVEPSTMTSPSFGAEPDWYLSCIAGKLIFVERRQFFILYDSETDSQKAIFNQNVRFYGEILIIE